MQYCEDYINEYSALNFSQIFFMTLGMLPILCSFPCWLVAKYVYEPMIKDYESKFGEVMDILKVPVPYEEKYQLKDISGNSVTKMNNTVVDYTPDGNVAMRYNSESESFEYWADSNINYKYLETVARKYVNSFGCGSIYIDRMDLLNKKVEKIKDEIRENIKKEEEEAKKDDEKDEKNDDVFANLKNYKKSNTKDVKKKITKNDIVCDQANKYLKKGKFTDFKEWMESPQNNKEKNSNEKGGLMSWLEWKNKSKND